MAAASHLQPAAPGSQRHRGVEAALKGHGVPRADVPDATTPRLRERPPWPDPNPAVCFSTGYGECLLDEPVGRTYELPTLLPGQIYNANRQCELMFGPGSQICPYLVSGLPVRLVRSRLRLWSLILPPPLSSSTETVQEAVVHKR